MPSDWYFGPVVCVCLLSRIFFLSFPRRRPSELPPLKRHFERKKRYIYVEIYHRVGSQRESLKQKNREGKHNQTRKISEGLLFEEEWEIDSLCWELWRVVQCRGSTPSDWECAPTIFLSFLNLITKLSMKGTIFFFLYLSPHLNSSVHFLLFG
jgi:hypothetical protein